MGNEMNQKPEEKKKMTESFTKLLQNDTRINILMYLRMNERLSLSQLTKLVGKSKSTVHHHIQRMIQGGIIQEISEIKPQKAHLKQLEQKYYELAALKYPSHSFEHIRDLPEDKQTEVFLATTKISKNVIFYLNQILDLLNNYLDAMEEIIEESEGKLPPKELLEMWEGTSQDRPIFTEHPVKFREIFYYATQVSEEVYRKYIEESIKLQSKIIRFREQNEMKSGSTKNPYFIYHISAPLGKPFILDSKEGL
jgi:DNA-binding transcriptional ArsR family regulator